MTVDISNEAFWTVIALFFLGVVFGVLWAGDTVLSIPEREVGWADAFVGVVGVDHLRSVDDFAFALVVGGVDGSWWVALEAFASLGDVAVEVALWARLACLVD